MDRGRKRGAKAIEFGAITAPGETEAVSGFISHEDRTRISTAIRSELNRYMGEHDNCPTIDETTDIYLGPRMGSPSAFSQVFELILVNLPDHKAAMKVMIVKDAMTEGRNEREMERAQAVSDLVTEGISPYFPILYGKAHCSTMRIHPPSIDQNSKYYDSEAIYVFKDAQERAVMRRIYETYFTAELPTFEEFLSTYGKRRYALGSQQYTPFFLAALGEEKYPEIKKLTIELNFPVEAHILISEMAWGDMGNYIKAGLLISPRHAYLFIEEVMRGIIALQDNLSLIHTDLHLENVLVRLVEDGVKGDMRPMALIHDFGRAESSTNLSDPREGLWDLRRFLTEFVPAATRNGHVSLRSMIKSSKTFLEEVHLAQEFRTMAQALEWWKTNANPERKRRKQVIEISRGVFDLL